MEKKSAEEAALAGLEEIKKEYYSRLDSIDLSFSSLKENKSSRDYFSDILTEEPPSLLEIPPVVTTHVTPTKVGVQSNNFLDSGFRPLSNELGSGASSPMLGRRNDEPEQLPPVKEIIPPKPKVNFFPEFTDEPVSAAGENKNEETQSSFIMNAPVEKETPLAQADAIATRLENLPVLGRSFSFYSLLVSGALLVGAISWVGWNAWSSSWKSSLPFGEPVGLAAVGDNLASLDPADNLIYTLKGSSGKPLGKYPFVCDHASGFAGFQNEFWCSEADKGDVRRYFLVNGNEYELQRVYKTFGTKIGALYSDGNYLWGADATSGKIFQYLIVKALTGILLTPIDRFTLPDISPAGLYASNGILWVLDAKSRRIKRFKISVSKAEPIDSYDLNQKIKALGALAGLSVNGERVYILTRHPSRIFSFDLKNLPHRRSPIHFPRAPATLGLRP